MNRFTTALCLTLLACVIFLGCATPLQEHKPQTPDEAAIKELLTKWESTWNTHDVRAHLALWDDSARIMHGRERKIASKAEYVRILPERMKAIPTIYLESPKISAAGNKADAAVYMKIGSIREPVTYHLAKKNNTWTIVSWDY